MKRLLAILLAILSLACFTAVSADEAAPVFDVNLIENGNCDAYETVEGVDKPTAWDGGGGYPVSTAEMKRGTEGRSIKMEITEENKHFNANEQRLNTTFTYEPIPDSHTRITGYLHIKSLGEGGRIDVRAQTRYGNAAAYDVEANAYRSFNTVSAENEWVPFKIDLVSKKESPITVYLNIYVVGTGTVYVDDVSVKNIKNIFLQDITTGWDPLTVGIGNNFGTRNVTFGFDDPNAVFEGTAGLYVKFDTYRYNANTRVVSYPIPTNAETNRNAVLDNTNYRFSFWFKPASETAVPYIVFGKGSFSVSDPAMTYPEKDRYITLADDDWTVKEVRADGWKKMEAYFKTPVLDKEEALRMVICSWHGNGKDASGCGYYDAFCLEKDYAEPLSVKNTAGEAIAEAKAGETVTISTHVLTDKTEADGGEDIAILLAAYNKEGKLTVMDFITKTGTAYKNKAEQKTADVHDKTITADSTFTKYYTDAENVELAYTIPDSFAGYTVKAFCWNGASLLNPIDEPCEVTVTAAE